MSVRRLLAAASAALLTVIGLATPAAADVLGQQHVPFTTMTPGRLWAWLAEVLVVTGLVIGWRVLARSTGRTGTGTGRRRAITGLAAGLAGTIIGGLVVATAKGGPGTGYGMVGGYVAVVIGLIAIVLGGLALNRSRSTV